MTIEANVLNDIRYDFSTGPDTEENNFANDEPFWNWFRENTNSYYQCDIKDLAYTDESNLPGNCFGNSQRITQQDDLEYCEGFVKVNGAYIFHGFNVLNNCIIDSTIQSNPNSFIDNSGELPSEYIGVVIPKDFVEDNASLDVTETSINQPSLLYEYYLSTLE